MAPGRRSSTSSSTTVPRSSLGRLWRTTHAPDYVGFVVLLTAWILLVQLVTPFHRMFSVNDLNISYPHASHERVSVPMNFVYALYIPLGILIAYNLASRSSVAKHEATYLSFAIAICLSSVLTDIIKNAVGRPRPDLLDRCHPAPDTKPNVLVTLDVCTAPDDHRLQDGWRSFPSGHSSFSFAGLGFLSLFLAGQLHVFRYAVGGRDLGRALLCLLPLVGATLIAISRCEDYRHDVYDVCVGSALGMTVAYWSYRRHWPRLSSPQCDEPHPPPGAEAQAQGWHRVRDEEEVSADVGYDFELGGPRAT
ncbi:Diacylglycerol pyrophosphate phosphatase 1 [Tolypocladium ophioglossoides CBS 100239]|uniref:Diacylglycerol pyrophosphate phosphatase 1 n=1 Tax=Tolypocladium ophioglossoides (strain CBS 100239) TaxID=1163406 RepID=A0A0L0NFE7_TOLOC|nr:Diacylglycerol pyrophosphate phosphatase 1 [Tolypocladium ophioglossoides CBS 100239]